MARTKAPEPVDLQEARVLLGHAARMLGVFQHAGRVCNSLIEAERVAASNVKAGEDAAKELATLQTKLQNTRDAIAAAQAEHAERLRAFEVEEGEAKSRLKALRAEADEVVATLLEKRG